MKCLIVALLLCAGGKLEYLVVTPAERKADITVVNCQHKSDDGEVGASRPTAPLSSEWAPPSLR